MVGDGCGGRTAAAAAETLVGAISIVVNVDLTYREARGRCVTDDKCRATAQRHGRGAGGMESFGRRKGVTDGIADRQIAAECRRAADETRQRVAAVAEGIVEAEIGRRLTVGVSAATIISVIGPVPGEEAGDGRLAIMINRAPDAARGVSTVTGTVAPPESNSAPLSAIELELGVLAPPVVFIS